MQRITLLIGILFLLTCGEKLIGQESNENKGLKDILFDTTRSTIITTKDAVHFAFNDSYSSSELNEAEYPEVQNLITQAILKYNSRFKDSNSLKTIGIDTGKYKYKMQIVPALNKNGQKEVWINAFCNSLGVMNWKSKLVFVKDGGNCFFNFKINLTEHKIYRIFVNGYA